MPKVSMVVVMMESLLIPSGIKWFRITNHSEMSSKARPTTTRPMTAPERKAICSPLFSECLAPAVVRLEAKVAVRMPRKPASPEKKPPVMKANGTQGFCVCSTKAMKENRINIRRKTKATTRYWRLR